MKFKSLLFGLSLFCINATQAATITVADGGIAVKNMDGSALTSGTVRIGWFANYTTATAATFAASLKDTGNQPFVLRDYIATNFVPVGEAGAPAALGTAGGANGLPRLASLTAPASGEPASGYSGVTGTISTSTWNTNTANSRDATGIPRGTRLFVLVYNNTDISRADQLGIYSATAWTTSTSSFVTAISMSMSVVDDALGTGATTEFFHGSKGSLVLGSFNQTVVPEPSASLLAGLAALGLISKRRRA